MKKITSICVLTILTFGMFTSIVHAGINLEHNRLYFNGYQTDTKIVSDIFDKNLSDNYKYKMEAIVYVGKTRYTSKLKNDSAYVDANRNWRVNETARYKYIRR